MSVGLNAGARPARSSRAPVKAYQSLSFTKPNSKLETAQPEPVPTSVEAKASDVRQTLLNEFWR